jgi:hypothetical protein
MDTIFHRLQRNIEKINESTLMEKLLKDTPTTDKMVDLQRDQMMNNTGGDGKPFERVTHKGKGDNTYKLETEKIWNFKRVRKIVAGEDIILKDTGDFHDKLKAIVDKDTAKLDSDGVKKSVLVRSYGPEIFGLSEKWMNELRTYIKQSGTPQKILKDLMLYGN